MNEGEAANLGLEPRHLERVRALLARHLPGLQVWAYGSRVKGSGHGASDLDLVVRNPRDPEAEVSQLRALRSALRESALPIRVEVADWARLPLGWREEIERRHVELQGG